MRDGPLFDQDRRCGGYIRDLRRTRRNVEQSADWNGISSNTGHLWTDTVTRTQGQHQPDVQTCRFSCSQMDVARRTTAVFGLCSHEYFHLGMRGDHAGLSALICAWETYTELLWAFEGITVPTSRSIRACAAAPVSAEDHLGCQPDDDPQDAHIRRHRADCRSNRASTL